MAAGGAAMTVHPVLPLPAMAVVAAVLVVAQVLALRRWRASGRNRTQLWRWAGVTAAAVLVLVAAMRVTIGSEITAARSAGDLQPNVFLVVDRSPNMAVEDLDNRARMGVARDDLQALIDRYPNARFAVIGFAAAPSLQWPLSADTWSLRPVLDSLDPYPYSPDAVTLVSAGAANTVLRYQLINAAAQYPRATNLVFYLGAGAPESRLPTREFDPPPGLVDGGAVLGYGTATGGPVPGTDIERSPVGATALRAVAEQLEVPYVARTTAAPLVGTLPDDGGGADIPMAAAGSQAETYWIPALAGAVLVLVELYLVLRDFRRSRFASGNGTVKGAA
jgi:hypothetical protein